MDLLKSFFVQGGFTPEEAEQISSNFILKSFQKGDFFVEEGKTSKYLGFIERALKKSFRK